MSSDYNFKLAAKFIADTRDFESGVSRIKNDLNSIDAISKNSMSSMSTMMKTYGASVTRMTTVPLIGGLTASYKMLAGYDEALRGLSKTTDLEGQALKDMGRDFEEMSRKIPLSVTALLEIGEAAGQLGIHNKNIKDFTKTIAALDVSTNLSKSQGASELAKFANVTQMSQDNFERLGSTIVELGNNLASTESDIVTTAQRLAGAGNIVGMTESQILGLSAALSSLGMEPEAAGSSMSRIIQGIEKYVATLSDELKVLSDVSGYSQDDFVKVWNNDPTKALVDFIEGLKRVKAEGKSVVKVLSEVGFNRVNDSRALQSLVSSGDMLQKSLELSNKAWEENTALQRESSIAYDSINSKIKLLGNNFAQIARIIGEEISPEVKKGMDSIKELTDKFIDMDKPQQSAIIRMVSMSAAVGPAIYGFGSLLNVLRPVTSLTYGFGNALNIIPSPLLKIGSGSRSASKGLNGFINGFSNFGVINSFGNSISGLNFSGVKQSLLGLKNPFAVVGNSISKTMNSLEKFDDADFLKRQQKMTDEVNKNIKSMFKPEENAINKKYKKLESPIEKSYVKEVEYINKRYDRALSKNKRLGKNKNISLSDMAMRERILLRDRKNDIAEAKKVYNDALVQNGLDKYIDKKLLESKREKALSAELAKQSGIFNKHNKKIKANIRANNLVSSLTSFFILPFKLLGNTLSNTVGIFGATVRMIPKLASGLLSLSKPVIGAGIFLSVKALQALSLIPKSMMAGFKSMLGLGGFALKIIGPITAIGAALSLAGLAVKHFEEPLKKAFKDIGEKGPLFINEWAKKITDAVPMFIERGIFLISNLGTALSKNIPSFAKGAVGVVSEIAKTLTSKKNLKEMFKTGKELIGSIFTAIENEAPKLLTTGFNILDSIVGQFQEDPSKIGRGLLKNITRVGDFVKKNVGIIFSRGSILLTSLSDILKENIPYIIKGIGDIMNIIIDVIGDNMPTVVSTGSHMINGMIDGIKGNLPLIKSTFGEVFNNAKEAIKEQIPGLQALWISVSDKLLPSFDFTSVKESFKQSFDFTSIKEDFKQSYDDLKAYLFGPSGIFAGGSESKFVTMYGEVSQTVNVKVVDFIIKGLETLNKNMDTIISGGLNLVLNGAGLVEKKVDNTVNSSQKLIPKMIDSLQTYNNKLIDEMSMESFKDPKSFFNKLAESGFRTSVSLNKTDEDGRNIIHQVADLLINAIQSAGLTVVFGMFSAASWLAGYLQYEFNLVFLDLKRMFGDMGSDFQILFTSIGKILSNLMTFISNPLDGKVRDEGYNKNQLEYERKIDEINKASRERAIDFYSKVKPFQPNMTMPTGRNSFAKDFGEFTTEELARINEINIYMDSDKISKYTVPKTLDNINKQMAIESY